MDFGIATVASITAIVYIIGLGVKASNLKDKFIPVICGILGIALGIAAFYLKIPEFPASDILTAAAVGGASGLASTGINQMVKQMQKEE